MVPARSRAIGVCCWGFGADPVGPPGDVGGGLAQLPQMGAAAPVPFGFRLRVIRQQPLTEGVIQRAAVVKIAHDPASGSASPAAACGAASALSGPGGFELADQRHDLGSDLVAGVGGRAQARV